MVHYTIGYLDLDLDFEFDRDRDLNDATAIELSILFY